MLTGSNFEMTFGFTITNITADITLNPLSTNPTKSSNTLKQVVGKLPTNFFSVFDHFVKLALKGLNLLFTNFKSFIPMKDKFRLLETMLFCCFSIWSSCESFTRKLSSSRNSLSEIFTQKNL